MNVKCPENASLFISDPKISAIPVMENHEPMFDLTQQDEISFGPSPEIPNNTDYTKVREVVFKLLKNAQLLLPSGLRLCLYEGYRSLNLQNQLFENRYATIKSQYLSWSQDQIFLETTKLVAPVINLDGTKNTPPHSTGGAIDVYLIDDVGNAIDMGIHPKDWIQDTDGSLSLTNSPIISKEASRNREVMIGVLEAVGFVNYPMEYWHWSYGDRVWAYYKYKPYAIYDCYSNREFFGVPVIQAGSKRTRSCSKRPIKS